MKKNTIFYNRGIEGKLVVNSDPCKIKGTINVDSNKCRGCECTGFIKSIVYLISQNF